MKVSKLITRLTNLRNILIFQTLLNIGLYIIGGIITWEWNFPKHLPGAVIRSLEVLIILPFACILAYAVSED